VKKPELINYPNPFSSETTIGFRLDQATDVTLRIYNIQGQEVSVPVNGRLGKGYHTIRFSAGNLPEGIYHAVLQSSTFVTSGKIILMR
jgi:hypothetical protein